MTVMHMAREPDAEDDSARGRRRGRRRPVNHILNVATLLIGTSVSCRTTRPRAAPSASRTVELAGSHHPLVESETMTPSSLTVRRVPLLLAEGFLLAVAGGHSACGSHSRPYAPRRRSV